MWKSVMTKLKPAPPTEQAIEGATSFLQKTSSPLLMRLRMIAKLSRILGHEVVSVKGRPRLLNTRARPAIQSRKMKLLKKMRVALGKKSKPKKANQKLRDSKYWRKFAEQKPMRSITFRLKEEEEEEEEKVDEPEVIISLNSDCVNITEDLIYNFTSGEYELVIEDDPLLNLLTIPSRILYVEENVLLQQQQNEKQQQQQTQFQEEYKKSRAIGSDSEDSDLEDLRDDSRRELEELYQGQISKEELARIDAQPNPFNFSDRVSQTTKIIYKDIGMQTAPPPSTRFEVNVGLNEIYHIYKSDYEETAKRDKKRKEEDNNRERGPGNKPLDPIILVAPRSKVIKLGEHCYDLGPLNFVSKVLERMVTQNILDDILQDFKYWEDGSDEYKPMDGSLLPLWRFKYENTRSFIVSDICWSPIFPDLFAAAYIACEVGGNDGPGMMCLYNLKNPATPERIFHAPCGVITIQFHPQVGSIMAAGWSDGTIVVYNVKAPQSSATITSTTINGKHLLPVAQVQWVKTQPGEELRFFSVALDGRVTQWFYHATYLTFTDLLNFREKPTKTSSGSTPMALEGSATCIAFCPADEQILLLGVDTGAVFQCSTISTSHTLTRYPAHVAPVRNVAWNNYHHQVFLTCSLDWTVKIWLKNSLSPLIVLDLGGSVVGVTWSPYSSSVVVAVTEECRVIVYDLYLRKCRPLCVQSLIQRRRITGSCVSFSPYYPIILVGGDKGHLVALKLSPNLRRVPKDAKGADAATLKQIELCKIQRLIETINR